MSLVVNKPVVSRIADVIKSRLDALIYEPQELFDFVAVERPTKIATYTPRNGTIVLHRGEVARVTELDCPGNPPALAYRQTFLIRVHIAPSERDTTPVEEYEDAAESEIIKAIRVDAQWYSMDGLAIHAEFGSQITAVSDGGYDGIAVPLIVTYRVSENNPYEVRA